MIILSNYSPAIPPAGIFSPSICPATSADGDFRPIRVRGSDHVGGGTLFAKQVLKLFPKMEGEMKIKYCRRYSKYVSQQHCEFFNEGHGCDYYSSAQWNSIKDLLQDEDRPQREVNAIIKPFKCNLMDRRYLNALRNKHRFGGRAAGVRI